MTLGAIANIASQKARIIGQQHIQQEETRPDNPTGAYHPLEDLATHLQHLGNKTTNALNNTQFPVMPAHSAAYYPAGLLFGLSNLPNLAPSPGNPTEPKTQQPTPSVIPHPQARPVALPANEPELGKKEKKDETAEEEENPFPTPAQVRTHNLLQQYPPSVRRHLAEHAQHEESEGHADEGSHLDHHA